MTANQLVPVTPVELMPPERMPDATPDEVKYFTVGEVRAALRAAASKSPDFEDLAEIASAMLSHLDTIRDEAKFHACMAAIRARNGDAERVKQSIANIVDICGDWNKPHGLFLRADRPSER